MSTRFLETAQALRMLHFALHDQDPVESIVQFAQCVLDSEAADALLEDILCYVDGYKGGVAWDVLHALMMKRDFDVFTPRMDFLVCALIIEEHSKIFRKHGYLRALNPY